MTKMLLKPPTKTTHFFSSASSPAATKVLNIPELLEQILYFVLTSPELDTQDRCKAANILRETSSTWAGTIDSSPTLSVFAFRNRKLSPTHIAGDINIPFLQCLKFELSEIDQLRNSQGTQVGLKDLKKFKNSQRVYMSRFPKLRKAVEVMKYPFSPPSPIKYLASDVLLIQPPPPSTTGIYLHFYGWGDLAWIGWLGRYSKPYDHHKLGNTIEFKYWHKVTSSSSGDGNSSNNVTGADLVNALTKVLEAFYSFDKGFFEVLRIELTVGNVDPPRSISGGIDYMYRWYLWNPKKFGGELGG
ncbi:hypothetical protein TWF481_011570 [Arthrobotrys musiformis]|uniref:F-box domain-containing protein n=1 Tax=Arthrobotrys musiformis TaxID=47236 RepID=A0AAV9W0L7_9PEZI